MLIRRLVPDDAPRYQALRLRGLQEQPSAFASSLEEEADTPLSDIAQRLAWRSDVAQFGAFEGDRLLGIVGLQREALRKMAHKGPVWGMYVAPEARRRGPARALLSALLDHAAGTMGLRQLNLGVTASDQAALRLYEALGFVRYALERDCLWAEGRLHDEVQMVCATLAGSVD